MNAYTRVQLLTPVISLYLCVPYGFPIKFMEREGKKKYWQKPKNQMFLKSLKTARNVKYRINICVLKRSLRSHVDVWK